MTDLASSASPPDWDVVVIGAGPVGLATAIELAQRGIRCLLVEKNERVGHAPRAKTCNVRTCEHLRRWGILERLRMRAPFGVDYPSNVVFATRLGGRQLARFENAFFCRPGRHPFYSAHAQWIPQYKLEETLLEHLLTLPCATPRFNTTVVGWRQDSATVTLQLETEQGIQEVRSSYVVAADGAGSPTRKALGISMEGAGALSRHRMLIFRSRQLEQAHALGPAVAYWLVNSDTPAVMGPMDTGGRWYFGFTARGEDDDAVAALRRATKLQFDVEVLSVGDWTAYRLAAERYRDGRIFLAGDACHLHPPYGGYGMNLGVGDAVDLGWKLAATLQGWGSDALLDSYEVERRPVHLRTIEEAVINHARSSASLALEHIEDDGIAGEIARDAAAKAILEQKAREFDTLGVVLGYRYNESPVIVPDGSAPLPDHYRDYIPSARPGSRAPHYWLTPDDSTAAGASLFDHFGSGYTLLVTQGDAQEAAVLLEAAKARGVPIKLLHLDDATLHRIYDARYALIRPDQHVAWRSDVMVSEPHVLLDVVTGLGHPEAGRIAA